MNLLAGQEQDIARADRGLDAFGPDHAVALQHHQDLFVEMTMRLRLRLGNVADELGHHVGAMLAVDQELVKSLRHALALGGIDLGDAMGMVRVEISRHRIQELQVFGARSVPDKQLHAAAAGMELEGFAGLDIDAGL